MLLKVRSKLDFSPRMKIGQIVEVDKIKWYRKCGSGIMVRVVGVWKSPKWFDLEWFHPKPDALGLTLDETRKSIPEADTCRCIDPWKDKEKSGYCICGKPLRS